MFKYGIGFVGQGTIYCFISTYFVVFMTNCVGVSSSKAGFIMSVALFVEMFAGMIVGNLSDRCTSKMGKRRPFVLISAIGLPLITVLLFRTVNFSEMVLMAYYLVLSIMFRILFSCFEIPYGAFGAEVTKGYNERTRLRTITRCFSILGNSMAYVIPLWVLDLYTKSTEGAWFLIGLIVSTVCFISWMSAFLMTKKYSVCQEKNENKNKSNILTGIVSSYKELIKLKTMRQLMIYKASFTTAYSIYNVGLIYYMKYCANLGNRYTSYLYIFSVIIFVAATPVINRTALRTGKERQQRNVLFASGIVCLGIYLFGKGTIAGTIIYIFIFALMQTSFWQLSPSIFYDQVEVDEFVHGKRREGDIISLVSVLGTVVSAIIVQVFGIFLDLMGFDAQLTVQSARTVGFLEVACILIPAVCFFIGWIVMKRFPGNQQTFDALGNALECRKKGESWDEYKEIIHNLF